MANKNGILKDENGNNLYPITLTSNVNGLDALLLDKATKDLSNVSTSDLQNKFKNFNGTITTGTVSGTGSSNVIGTKGYWRLITIWSYETQQSGAFSIYVTDTIGVDGIRLARTEGERAYWGSSQLCASALIPPNKYVYVGYNKIETPSYSEVRIGG